MSVATQILFNSPALHSLKRDQLVKLCKIHSLKANGKNKDLIDRLQQHAKMLPPDDPLSIATRSDNLDAKVGMESEGEESEGASDYGSTGTYGRSSTIPRPSEQWEVVMDVIPEVDEETVRSNRGGNSNSQAGEFGTNGGKAPSVTSSLKSIVTSLGLKRNNNSKSDNTTSSSKSGLSGEGTTASQESIPSVTEDLPPVDPIPGQMNLRGMPAPANARLSITQAPTTTTIRLVSGEGPPASILSPPRLKPFETTFDLVPATPSGNGNGGPSVPVWPPFSPGAAQIQSIYPSLAAFQGFGGLHKQDIAQSDENDPTDMSIDMPGVLAQSSALEPTPKKSTPIRPHTGAVPRSTERPKLLEPEDIFSPGPQSTNASPRPRPSRSEPFIFGSPLPQHNLSNREFRSAAQSILDEMNSRLAADGVEGVNIDVLQNRQTHSGVEGADDNQADKAVGGSATAMYDKAHQEAFDKMESIVQYAQKRARAPEPIVSKKRKSSLVIKERKVGGASRRRTSGLKVANKSAKTKAIPGGFGDEDDDNDGEEEEEDDNKKKEEEHNKKKKKQLRRRRQENKKKNRRSSRRPTSPARRPPPQKAKATSRFGFLSTAKSIVQSVWNRGAGSSTQSQIPVAKTRKEDAKPPTTVPQVKKVAVVPGSSGHPPLNNMAQAKREPSGNTASERPAAQTLAPPASSAEGSGTTSSRTTRAPIPTFSPQAPKTATSQGGHNRNGSVTGVSSLGMRTRASENTSSTSMGKRTSIKGKGTEANSHSRPTGNTARSRPSSTLMAPTASSLAKMTTRHPASLHSENVGSVKSGATKAGKDVTRIPAPSSPALGQITNGSWSPQSPRSPTSKIFSQPPSPGTMRPLMSLTAAAESIVNASSSSSSKPPIPPKPKVLPGRKPRISRSKVIARLASQRAAEANAPSGGGAGAGPSRGKTRSSIGAGVSGKTRVSRGGAKSGDMLMGAKRRARQSEYARRRSQATGSDGAEPMEVRVD
ncbi:hypothetical protein M404DRAFT_994763 [Pisolithus tinctorius Marx 270]|uniref:SAP domain-containing protein n=1 Tax=Pisolithus tinctorius Marx 270 TaxID=870435 RepID=A0A0C3PQ42_PISTI|nr:hypothetical protein M404DRAFT_994763 [Pisolithus tinctorius Marx 270]